MNDKNKQCRCFKCTADLLENEIKGLAEWANKALREKSIMSHPDPGKEALFYLNKIREWGKEADTQTRAATIREIAEAIDNLPPDAEINMNNREEAESALWNLIGGKP